MPLDHGMTAGLHLAGAVGGKGRAAVALLRGYLSQGGVTV